MGFKIVNFRFRIVSDALNFFGHARLFADYLQTLQFTVCDSKDTCRETTEIEVRNDFCRKNHVNNKIHFCKIFFIIFQTRALFFGADRDAQQSWF
jgi:hypothetical protein